MAEITCDLEQVEFVAVGVLVGQFHHNAEVAELRVALQSHQRRDESHTRVPDQITGLEVTQMWIVVEAVVLIGIDVLGCYLTLVRVQKAQCESCALRHLVLGLGGLQVQCDIVYFLLHIHSHTRTM
jgi:hypothetical protein